MRYPTVFVANFVLTVAPIFPLGRCALARLFFLLAYYGLKQNLLVLIAAKV